MNRYVANLGLGLASLAIALAPSRSYQPLLPSSPTTSPEISYQFSQSAYKPDRAEPETRNENDAWVCYRGNFKMTDTRDVSRDIAAADCRSLSDSYEKAAVFYGIDPKVEALLTQNYVKFTNGQPSMKFAPSIIEHSSYGRHEMSHRIIGSDALQVYGFTEPLSMLLETPDGMSFTDYISPQGPFDGKKTYKGYFDYISNGGTMEEIFSESPALKRNGVRQGLGGALLWMEIDRRGYDATKVVSDAMKLLKIQYDITRRPIVIGDFAIAYRLTTGDDISRFLVHVWPD